MNDPLKENKETMIRLLDALFPGVKIYLFGSRARGTHRETSDIDIAIDAGRELTIHEVAQARNVLDTFRIAQTIDVVDMHSIPDRLKEIILKEGIVWRN